jgi:hypothetical protein
MSESEQMTEVVVFLSSEDEDAIEERLEYGDSKSAWIREACRRRLEKE